MTERARNERKAHNDRTGTQRQDVVREETGYSEHRVPQRQHGVALRLQLDWQHVRRRFVQARLVLHAAQVSVGIGRSMADTRRQQSDRFGAFEQGDVAGVGSQFRVRASVAQHQVCLLYTSDAADE